MKKKVLIWLMVIVLVLGAAGAACYYYRDTIKGWFGGNKSADTYNYGAELKALQSQIEANNNEILAAQQEINENQALINEKQAESNAEIAEEIAALLAKNEALQNRIATLEAENQRLKEQIVELQNEIQDADLIQSREQVTVKMYYKDAAVANSNISLNVINYQSGAKVLNGSFPFGNVAENEYTYLYLEFPDDYFNDVNFVVLVTPRLYSGQSNKPISFYIDSMTQNKFCINIYNHSGAIKNLGFNIVIYDSASWGA